jgi:hypothetical protein
MSYTAAASLDAWTIRAAQARVFLKAGSFFTRSPVSELALRTRGFSYIS